MADETQEKMIQDSSLLLNSNLDKLHSLVKGKKFDEALELLLSIEKQARNNADATTTGRVLVEILRVFKVKKDWTQLNEHIMLLTKKRSQLKQAIIKMIQEAMSYLDLCPNINVKLQLIDTLRTVTEGKIYVEVERARLTRELSRMKEAEGNFSDAADILNELQIETFGSMDKREKAEFVLEQMRLCFAKSDFVKIQILSRKIGQKFFAEPANIDLKLIYYKLMIDYAIHEKDYLSTSKYYREIYESESIQQVESKWSECVKNMVIFAILSPHNNEQWDILNRLRKDKKLEKITLYLELVKLFTTEEVIKWSQIKQVFAVELSSNSYFGAQNSTQPGWSVLHKRAVEHSIRVASKYYSRLGLKRLSTLLDFSQKETEELLCTLVENKTITARIDRTSGYIDFQATTIDSNEILNEWTNNVQNLLSNLEKAVHLITKEEMVVSLTSVQNLTNAA